MQDATVTSRDHWTIKITINATTITQNYEKVKTFSGSSDLHAKRSENWETFVGFGISHCTVTMDDSLAAAFEKL